MNDEGPTPCRQCGAPASNWDDQQRLECWACCLRRNFSDIRDLNEATGGEVGQILRRMYDGIRRFQRGLLADAEREAFLEDARRLGEILDGRGPPPQPN